MHYEFTWDISVNGGLSLKSTADSTEFEVTFTSGTYCHTDISGTATGYQSFALALADALNSGNPGTAVYTVTWNGTTGYQVDISTGTCTLVFSTTSDTEAGENMRKVLGFSSDQAAAASITSDVRPFYLIIPAIQGRSNKTDRYEPEGITQEGKADDGTVTQISKATSEELSDWNQTAEVNTTPSVFSSPGTPAYIRHADDGTSANDVPWTYQHAWRHMRTHEHYIYVVDGADTDVHKLRAEGLSFHPVRFASDDFDLWTIPFRTYFIGDAFEWTPDQLSPLGWWRADRGVVHSALEVSDWVNFGTASDLLLSQSTAGQRPDLIESSANANDQATIHFDGGDWLNSVATASWEQSAQTDDMTIVAVFYPTATQRHTIICTDDFAAGGGFTVEARVGGASRARFFQSGAGVSLTDDESTLVINTLHLQTVEYLGETAPTVCSLEVGEDGASNGASTVNFTDVIAHTGTEELVVGNGGAGASSNPLDGELAELVLLDRTLTTAERASFAAYLNTRYAFTLTDVLP